MISFKRAFFPLMRYSLSPLRKSFLVTLISSLLILYIPSLLSKTRETSQKPIGLRLLVPLKMTSCMVFPCPPLRMFLAFCSPKTHLIASHTLLFPQPFGPTIHVTPVVKSNLSLSAKDLKPYASNRFKCMILFSSIVFHATVYKINFIL